jgi:hypothetical protein
MKICSRNARAIFFGGAVTFAGLSCGGGDGSLKGLGDYQGCEPRHTTTTKNLLAFGYDGVLRQNDSVATIGVLSAREIVTKKDDGSALELSPGHYELVVDWSQTSPTAKMTLVGSSPPTTYDIKIDKSNETPNEGPGRFDVIDTPRKYGKTVRFEGIQIHRDKKSAHFIPLRLKGM